VKKKFKIIFEYRTKSAINFDFEIHLLCYVVRGMFLNLRKLKHGKDGLTKNV